MHESFIVRLTHPLSLVFVFFFRILLRSAPFSAFQLGLLGL